MLCQAQNDVHWTAHRDGSSRQSHGVPGNAHWMHGSAATQRRRPWDCDHLRHVLENPSDYLISCLLNLCGMAHVEWHAEHVE